MSIPPAIVSSARIGWNWQWNKLMNGLAPADQEGNYCRPESNAKKPIIIKEGDLINRSQEEFPILIIGRSCPWAHRTWLVYVIKNLKSSLNLIIAEPDHKAGLWKVNPPLMGCKSLLEVYKLCNAPPSHRATVPALIDPCIHNKENPKLLGNESAQLVETLNKWPEKNRDINDLSPEDLNHEINSWQNMLQESVNNGVYKCGFARKQSAYNRASEELFASLNKIEKSLLQQGPWLCGESLTIADIRLFPTLIRWESVYAPLFGCSQKPLSSFPKLLDWRQRFFNIPNVAETCNASSWRRDYFGALFPIHPSNIIPKGPSIEEIINLS